MRFLPVSLLCIAAVSGLHAFQNADAATPRLGTIHGRVVESPSGDPVKKVAVILRRGQEPGVGAISDATGEFVFANLDPGAYTISVERTGFILDPDSERAVANVQPEPAVSEITVKLIRTGAVSGRVFDTDGDPVTGAAVSIVPVRQRKGTAPQSNAFTNDRGEYRCFDISPGRYRIAVSYQPRPEQMQIKMQPAKTQNARTPEDTYAVTYYPAVLDLRQAAIVNVEAGTDLQGFDVRILRAHGVTLRGKVSGVASGAIVLVTLGSIGQTLGFRAHDTLVQNTAGTFELPLVLPGTYILNAGAPLNGKQLSASRIIDVGESDIVGLELQLAAPQTITGTIVLPEGRKLPGSVIALLLPRESRDNRGGGMAQPAEGGAFEMRDVPPGDYDLILGNTGPGDDLYVSAIRMQDENALAEGIHVGPLPLAPLKVTLQANGGTLQLDVRDDKQTPVPDASVRLVPDPPRRAQMALYSECKTGADGTCTVLGVAPGKYHAFAFAQDRPFDFRDPAAVAEIEDSGKAIEIAAGENKSLELTLVPDEK